MTTMKNTLFLSLTTALFLLVGAHTAQACDIWTGVGCTYDTSGNLTDESLADAGYPPDGYYDSATVTTSDGTYTVSSDGSITDSSGNVIGSVDINGTITLTSGETLSVSGLGEITVTGQEGSVTYSVTIDENSTLSPTEMINSVIVAAAYAQELDSGEISSALQNLLNISIDAIASESRARPLTATEEANLVLSISLLCGADTSCYSLQNINLSTEAKAALEARAAAEGVSLDSYINKLIREYGLYETSGICSSANCTYDSSLGLLSGWFSTINGIGDVGDFGGGSWTPPPGCEGDACLPPGGGGGGEPPTDPGSWWCAYIDCTGTRWQDYLGNPGDGGSGGSGGSGGTGTTTHTRPDIRYEEF